MKKTIIVILGTLFAIVLSGAAFLTYSPQFGESPSSDLIRGYEEYPNFYDGAFHSVEPRGDSGDVSLSKFFRNDNNQRPLAEIESDKIDYADFLDISEGEVKLIWFGHSTVMINYSGTIILLDPMLGKYAAPVPMIKRYNLKHPVKIEDLPNIDAVIISHDHYDHLNYRTIKKLRIKVAKFFVPIGIGSHLKKWNVSENKIVEFYWSDKINFGDIEIVCLPARHFSGRRRLDKNTTLWASWALIGSSGKIFWSGNTGYGKHFSDIGNKYGPFDIALLDGGQYNKAWPNSHMFPDQTVLAAKDLNAKIFMTVHWGAFTLSTHPWVEPVEKSIQAAKSMNQPIIFPKIGEIFNLKGPVYNQQRWWEQD